jgi:hypothetical protein
MAHQMAGILSSTTKLNRCIERRAEWALTRRSEEPVPRTVISVAAKPVPGGTPMIAKYMAAAAATILLASGPAATAQTAGSTSGPAVGSPVVPNTAVQKENPANPATAERAKEGLSPGAAVSAGSPGAIAKEGTQGGPAPGSGGSGVAQTTGGVSPGGAIGAGAPGSTARQGTQGGPAPNPAQSK